MLGWALSWLSGKTVDTILDRYHAVIRDLEEVAAKELENVKRHEDDIVAAFAKKDAASTHADRAQGIADKMRALFS